MNHQISRCNAFHPYGGLCLPRIDLQQLLLDCAFLDLSKEVA